MSYLSDCFPEELDVDVLVKIFVSWQLLLSVVYQVFEGSFCCVLSV